VTPSFVAFCNPNARLGIARKGSRCVSSWYPPCPPRLRVFMRMAILPSGPTACNRGDRTDGTDGTPTSHEETLAYYCELRHHAAVPGLRLGVSTRPRVSRPAIRQLRADEGQTERRHSCEDGLVAPYPVGASAPPVAAVDVEVARRDDPMDRTIREDPLAAGAFVRRLPHGIHGDCMEGLAVTRRHECGSQGAGPAHGQSTLWGSRKWRGLQVVDLATISQPSRIGESKPIVSRACPRQPTCTAKRRSHRQESAVHGGLDEWAGASKGTGTA